MWGICSILWEALVYKFGDSNIRWLIETYKCGHCNIYCRVYTFRDLTNCGGLKEVMCGIELFVRGVYYIVGDSGI